MEPLVIAAAALLGAVGGAVLGMLARTYWSSQSMKAAHAEARRIEAEARARQKELILEAKDEKLRMQREAEDEARARRNELSALERRLLQRDEQLDQRTDMLEQRDRKLLERELDIDRAREEVAKAHLEQVAALERVSQVSAEDAKALLLEAVREEAEHDAVKLGRAIERKARDEADEKARDIIITAIQRVAADHTAEHTVTVVHLPNDEMKGRIIGREGRNIRAFEAATGTNLIIDDTPEAVVLSCFDPIRREMARLTLEKLIGDGRIQPARIEDVHEKSVSEVEREIREGGEWAVLETGITDLHPELVRVLGRLKFRTSYGQNVLKHVVEAAHIAGMIASELGTDVQLAKRCTLLHDIGKAVTHEVEGSHALIGAEIARRLKERPEVCHAIEAHHGEVEQRTIEAVITQTADAISGARPGARRETLETYVKRLERLEQIAMEFPGVDKVYAMQAGREVRVMVKPDEIDDLQAEVVARDIAKKVEEELQYPGQIRITVIRELRASSFAK